MKKVADAPLSTSLTAVYTATIDRVTGKLSISIPPFSPKKKLNAGPGTTHFKIISAGTEINFESGVFTTDSKESDYLPFNSANTALINLENSVTAASTHPLLLVLGVEFSQEINGVQYPLNDGSANALAIVMVDGGV